MKYTNCLLALPMALLLSADGPPAKDSGKSKQAPAQSATAEKDNKEWKRSTEGHRPQDLDGDGIITRNEWPGNDASFREVDTDGDGKLTKRDRGYAADGKQSSMYDRPVNDYPKRSDKSKSKSK